MRIAVLLVLLVTSPARADLRADVHLGGGLEGGMITGAPRPDAVAAAGIAVEALLPGRSWGLGVSAEATDRLTTRDAIAEEANFDLTLRFSTNPKFHAGFGAGIRRLALAERGDVIHGVDMFRLDYNYEIVKWSALDADVGLDFYFAWTFGCYSGTRHDAPAGDMLPPGHAVTCGDTITTTYVMGLQTSMTWR